MSWRVLYIEESDYLNLYLDNLKIKKGIDETTVPLSDINSIIVDNNKTNISLSLINKCMEYKVNIITCDIYHLPNGIIIPYSGNYQSALQLRKQIEWKEETKNIIWQYIIKKKILNQAKILELKDKKQCIKCHAEIDENAVFCPKCGEKQPEIEVKEAEVVTENLENSDVKPENATEAEIVEEKVSGEDNTEREKASEESNSDQQ